MGRRCRFFCRASISRLFFAIHGAMVYVWIYHVRGGGFSVYFGIPLVLLPIEMIITLCCTKHGEWKWFSPALMLYLLCVIPSIGFMHVDIHQRRIEKMGYPDVEKCQRLVKNSSSFPAIDEEMILTKQIRNLLKLTEFPEVFEQSTMFLVILGRWMLPKGNLTREQLSQLLLVYLGMAADILEFSSESLAQTVVACDLVKIGIVNGIWGMSLCQFTLVLTSVAGPKIRNFRGKKGKRDRDCANDKIDNHGAGVIEEDMKVKRPSICGSEIWSLLIVLFLQDCPFLAMRLYLIITIKVVDRAMLFFAGKNFLVFMLVTYRIIVLCSERNDQTKVKPMPLVGVPQPQPNVDAIVVREQKPSWSIGPLLPRVNDFTNRLRDHVREITSGLGTHVPSESGGSTPNQTTPSVTVMEWHSVEVTQVDDVDDSVSPVITETEMTDTARSSQHCSDDRPTQPDDESEPDLHNDVQPVPLMVVEVENEHEEMASPRRDIFKENLQAVRNNLTLGLDVQIKVVEVNDGSIDHVDRPSDESDINRREFKDTH